MSAELPVAIVGIGCKFPGGSDTKDLYYEFLRNKGDGMGKPPPDRWDRDEWGGYPGGPGKYNSPLGGFINGIDQFDPLEFGISMKEAQHLDPSSRLILEVAHQALVDSGLDYRNSHTGVYVAQLLLSASELGDDDRYQTNYYSSLGKCIALRANRVSFIFDLRGPSLILDTACSSSATAMHVALSALKLGEIDQALIIGGSIMTNPMHNVMFSELGVLSPTGSSKSFDAAADGYARAEGFGAILIKRLDKAIIDNDHVYSIITGTSSNSNGKGISLTTPDGDMQAETIRNAYSVAKRQPKDAFFVELHATGTPVGDPIEVNAAGNVFSVGRDSVLRVGSVKANIGHTEGCSFIASLIKISLMLKYKEIIPNVRYENPNPNINFSKWFMTVQTELEPITAELAAPDGKWVASISSSGIGGSNSHVVLESFESVPSAVSPTKEITDSFTTTRHLYLFIIAGHTESAVVRWKTSLATFYQGITEDHILRSLSYNLARQSRSCAFRAFAVGSTISDDIRFSKSTITNLKVNPKLCLVFAGQGPQHIAMGRELCATYPVFLATIKQNDGILVKNYGKESFLERTGLFIPNEQAKLPTNMPQWPVEDVVYAIVFMQLALVDLIKSVGIEYSYVVGHSIGEIAVGYASGHYDKITAIGIAVARAMAMKMADGNGSMVALGICLQRARDMINEVLRGASAADGLWIAAINSPDSVTVAGQEELIDVIVGIAKDTGVFAAKLRVTCAFHTPLMEPQEEVFRNHMKAVSVKRVTPPVVRTMSTVDGQWLERDMDVDYFWDNIHQPVLFGDAITKIVKENGSDHVLFLEIAPHPVLRDYIIQCGGKAISLAHRPNLKVPAQNSGEHHQFLEGIGTLLTAGFKDIDLAKLCASPDGRQQFFRCQMPDYPYDKITCWSESASSRSMLHPQKPRPLASSLFRMSSDTHPDLTGHVIFDVPLFPAAGYLESVLENGAMIIKDMVILLPLVLNARGTVPAHAGCVLEGNRWEFRTASTNTYDNGSILLDAVHARGTFLRHNPQSKPSTPQSFDMKSKLALSRGLITGVEFYKALPSAFGYREYFSNHIKEVHEIPDENSWGGSGYLVKLEMAHHDQRYIVHPGLLDSIMHSALALFIDMKTKSFDFSGTYLPAKFGSVTRWDGGDNLDFNSQLHGNFWTYLTVRDWVPEGSLKCDYIVTNSECRILLTIEGLEFVLAPNGESVPTMANHREECLTTIWQPKMFPLTDYILPSAVSFDGPSYLRMVFEELIINAQSARRYVIRTLDLDTSSSFFAKTLRDTLVSCLSTQLIVEYFCAGSSAKDADAKAKDMQYPHGRPLVWDPSNIYSDEWNRPHSIDIVLQKVDLLCLPSDIGIFLQYLVPSGVLLLFADGRSDEKTEAESMQQLDNLTTFVKQLEALPELEISVARLDVGGALILVHTSVVARTETRKDDMHKLVIHHFTHGTEGKLVKIIDKLSDDSEMWIIGDDNAVGMGALGIAACVIAESPNFVVRSLLFEDHGLGTKARDDIVRSLHQRPSLLEQHMKYTRTGDIFVRRLVYPPHIKVDSVKADSAVTLSPMESNGTLDCPPRIGPTELQVSIDSICVDSASANKSCVAFLGTVTSSGEDVKRFADTTKVLGITNHPIPNNVLTDQSSVVPLPSDMTDSKVVALPIASLVPWLALVENAKITGSSTILLLGAGSCIGFVAVQLCQRFGAKFFCTVEAPTDAKRLSVELSVDEDSVTTSFLGNDISPVLRRWLAKNNLYAFDVVFNLQGNTIHGAELNLLTERGHYIHHNPSSSDGANLPSGAPITHLINMPALVRRCPSRVASTLADVFVAHVSEPLKLPSHAVSFSRLSNPSSPSFSKTESFVATTNVSGVTQSGQLFDPRKSYILVGGSSELGIRIALWMASRGARHFVLTSRRGAMALTKVDLICINHLRLSDVSVTVLAKDASKRRDMATVIACGNEMAPIGGILVMTVVSRDGIFSDMDQEAFDDVYLSKVKTLDTILSSVYATNLDFLLLFSSIGSVFGNAGQAAYCASQLYLDRTAELWPNTISISLPPITDSGLFKRLILSSKGLSSVKLAAKIGVTTAQVCSFIADALVRRIPHYVPMIAVEHVPEVFSACEPLLYCHLLPAYSTSTTNQCKQIGLTETPVTLFCELLGLTPDQISENVPLRNFGLDSLGAIRYSRQLKRRFGIKINQFELLSSATIGSLNNTVKESGIVQAAKEYSNNKDDERLAYGASYSTDASSHQFVRTEPGNKRKSVRASFSVFRKMRRHRKT